MRPKTDREVILEAVEQIRYALKHAASELKAACGFRLEAVKQNGYAIRHAESELKTAREFMLVAVKHSGSSLHLCGAGAQACLTWTWMH